MGFGAKTLPLWLRKRRGSSKIVLSKRMGSGVSPDPDVADYAARVVAAGGALQEGDAALLTTFKTTLVTAGIWDKILDCGFFLGGFAGCKVKFKYATAGLENLTLSNFVSGDYIENKGLNSPNAVNRIASTGVAPTSHSLSNTNISASIFVIENTAQATHFLMSDNAPATNGFALGKGQVSVSGTTARRLMTLLDVPYFQQLSLTSNLTVMKRDYSNFVSTSLTSAPPAFTFDTVVDLFAGKNGGSNIFASGTLAWYHIGSYLTNAELETLYNAVKTFLIGKGRYTETPSLLCFGDSITYGASASAYNLQWSWILANALGLRQINMGVSGSRLRSDIASAIGGYARCAEILKYTQATRVCLQYGMNDMNADVSGGTPAVIADFQAKYIEIANLVKTMLPAADIYVGSISYSTSSDEPKRLLYNEACRQVAVQAGIKYVDVYGYMAANGASSLVSGDNVHPNNDGHTAIAFAYQNLGAFVS